MSGAFPEGNQGSGKLFRLRKWPASSETFAVPKLFFQSMEKVAGNCLTKLKDSVLPLYLRERERGMEAPGYQPAVWGASWDWAVQFHLVKEGKLQTLKSEKAAQMVRAARIGYPQAAPESVTVGPTQTLFGDDDHPMHFALGDVAPIVLATLESWADKAPHGDGPLRWVIPEDATIYDTMTLESLEQLTARVENPNLRLSGTVRQAPPYVYRLGPLKAWNVRGETRKEAEERLRKEFGDQLPQWLDEQAANAKRLGFEELPANRQREHFDWLVRYQVEELRYPDIHRLVEKERGEKMAENTIHEGVKRAARLLIGPNYKDWLRKSPPGRRRKDA